MSTYEVLSLMLLSANVLISVLSFRNGNNH